jgi:hypothetical protein
MNLLGYGIVPAGTDVAPWQGLTVAALTLAVGPAESTPADVPRLLNYAAAIQRLHNAGPLLPLRYGCVQSAAAWTQWLTTQQATYVTALAELGGGCEWSVRWESTPTAEPASGTAFLTVRRAHYAAQTTATAWVQTLPVVRARVEPTPRGWVAHLLVPRAAPVPTWPRPPATRLHGPFPVYHFVP